MRRTLLALACGSPLLLAGPALAAAGQPITASGSGWVSRPVNTQVVSGPLDPVNGVLSTSTIPAVPVSTSQVPAGDLDVSGGATTDGEPGSESYVAFDLSQLDPATTEASSMVMTLTVDAAYAGSTGTTPAAPPLQACLVTGHFFRTDNGDWASRPPEDCAKAVAGTYDATTATFRFDLSSFAAAWVGPDAVNEGVAIRPPAGYGLTAGQAPFDLAFLGGDKLVAVLGPTVTTVTATTTGGTRPASPAKVIKGGVPASTGQAAAPAAVDVAVPPGAAAPVPQALPAISTPLEAYAAAQAQAPVVAGPPAAPQTDVTRPEAFVPVVSAQGDVPVFWLAVVAGVLLLLATSWVSGMTGPAVLSLPRRG